MKKTVWLLVGLTVALFNSFLQEVRGDAEEADTVQSLKRQIQELDQKVRVLERKQELEREEAGQKKKETPKLTANAEQGYSFTSADDAFQIRLRGLIQADSRSFIEESVPAGTDTFLLRRARPILEGRAFRDFDFLFVPDFGGSSVAIQDAFVNYRYNPSLQLKAGKFKVPVGLELLQSDQNTFFTERALPTNLVPNRDVGFQLHGEGLGGVLNYAAGVFNGVADGRSTSNLDTDGEREFAGRIFALPFKQTDIEPLRGLGIGLGASLGDQQGTGAGALPSGYLTTGQQTFFTYRSGSGTAASPNILADGKHWRLAPQAYQYWGPFGLLGEYVISSQQLRRDAGATVNRATIDNTAWQIAGSYVLTGENASYSGIKPRNDFNIKNGTWGAFELVSRFSELHIDEAAFPLYATASSARSAQEWGIGLNWYLNRWVRISADFSEATFQGGDSTTNVVRLGEDVVMTRVQLAF